ncbi:MAG: glycine--tRNA ligase subunit beta [Thermoanaerobacterales bacterium]|nr:glycine--tRNA ligase subunit beta [Thermoanaerobacterales bacterium]
MARDFLLEIGIEELPARFLGPALVELAALARDLFDEQRLSYGVVNTYGTPRRLVLYVQDLAEAQASLVREVKGPPAKAAFDIDGKPTKAALGFARNQGVAVEELVIRPVGQVDYVYAVREENGRPAVKILPEIAPRLITGLSFPKPMRWGNEDLKFARPIRWMVCLFGSEAVPFTVAGVTAGRLTLGHRFLNPGPHRLERAADYFGTMREAYVLVDPDERRQVVWEQVVEAAAAVDGRVAEDESLLEEVANLLEYPTAFPGSFPESYLRLPDPVLVTPMREHQRYFPVYGADGTLTNRFVGVHNGTPEHIDVIRAGNEKVLRARLADAAFFFEEDLQTPLAAKVDGLKKIVFQEDLGTVHEKVERLEALAGYLAEVFDLAPAEREHALRAARLCKADLVTSMVYEFPELQGVMGREYALRSGEDPAVAEAVHEHYLPRSAGDDLPATLPGLVLALAERADNLVGAFGLGIQPSGSQDPYALRRQALGICHLLLERERKLDLDGFFRKAHALYGPRLKLDAGRVVEDLKEFLKQRLRVLFGERGLAHDVIDAVLAVPFHDILDAWRRAQALALFRDDPAFQDAYTALTRAGNLARQAREGTGISPRLFADPAEGELFAAYRKVREVMEPLLARGSYLEALRAAAALRPPVDRFFDAVLVMAEDPAVRENRLALLAAVAALGQRVADLGRLVVA